MIRYCSAALAVACLGAFLLQAKTSSYDEWRFDAGTKRIAEFIRTRDPQRSLVLRASWPLEPTLNFYRVLYGLNWAPVDRSPVNQQGSRCQHCGRTTRTRLHLDAEAHRSMIFQPQPRLLFSTYEETKSALRGRNHAEG